MWVIVHACTGLALAALVPLPLPVLLVLALVLHVLLDTIPHWDYTRRPRRTVWASLDVAASLALVVGGYAVGAWPAALALTAGVSALPDLDVADAVLPIERSFRWFPSHRPGFPHGRCRAATGIPLQAAIAAVSLALALLGPH